MLRISVANLRPGMQVGRNIFNAEGNLMLSQGVCLTDAYIKRLSEIGIVAVYIESAFAGEELPEVPEVLTEATRIDAMTAIQDIFHKLQLTNRVDVGKAKTVAKGIVAEIIANPQVVFHLNDIRLHDDYTFAHSVNVAVLSTIIGSSLGYDEGQLRELAIGALLHDVGKMLVPKEIINKPGRLNAAESEFMRRHSEMGFELLRKEDEMPLLSAHIAFQHHEKVNGKGYPRALEGDEIHEYSRIAAIADVYDALTSERSYSRASLPHEAHEFLMAGAGSHFDASLLDLFFKHVAIYPIGALVQLNSGEIGVVVQVKPDLHFRPRIRILVDADGKNAKPPREVDMSQHLTAFIERVLSEKEVIAFLT